MKVRLQSRKSEDTPTGFTMGVHAPGLIEWAKSVFICGQRKKSSRALVGMIADGFKIKSEVALAILTGEVEYAVDGDDVVFDWPDDPTEGGA